MPMLSIEHTTTAYRSDFVLYGCAVAGLSAWLALRAPADMGLQLSALAAAGLLGWSGIEYALHRFVLHGLPPFKGWHREHHLMQPCCFGVTSGVWCRVFRIAGHRHHSAPVRIPVRRHNG